jgi:hypothetical protein
MSYTQKMRSWIITIFGAILAVLLWTTAKQIRTEGLEDPESTPKREDFAKKLNGFSVVMKQSGKTLKPEDNLELNNAIADAAKRSDYTQAGVLVDSLAVKYLSGKDPVSILTQLVMDSRKRLSKLEGNLEDSRTKGQAELDKARQLANPDNLPAPTASS